MSRRDEWMLIHIIYLLLGILVSSKMTCWRTIGSYFRNWSFLQCNNDIAMEWVTDSMDKSYSARSGWINYEARYDLIDELRSGWWFGDWEWSNADTKNMDKESVIAIASQLIETCIRYEMWWWQMTVSMMFSARSVRMTEFWPWCSFRILLEQIEEASLCCTSHLHEKGSSGSLGTHFHKSKHTDLNTLSISALSSWSNDQNIKWSIKQSINHIDMTYEHHAFQSLNRTNW